MSDGVLGELRPDENDSSRFPANTARVTTHQSFLLVSYRVTLKILDKSAKYTK